MSRTFKKDPDAELDFMVDWADWLEPMADTIASVVWVFLNARLITTPHSPDCLGRTTHHSGATRPAARHPRRPRNPCVHGSC